MIKLAFIADEEGPLTVKSCPLKPAVGQRFASGLTKNMRVAFKNLFSKGTSVCVLQNACEKVKEIRFFTIFFQYTKY